MEVKNLLFTNQESKLLDNFTINQIGISGEVLMGMASESIFTTYYKEVKEKKIIILAGKGNNGGDGIAIGILFACYGKKVKIFFHSGAHSNEYNFYLKKAKKLNLNLTELQEFLEWNTNWDKVFLIDSLLGTGFTPPVSEFYKKVINKVNELKKQHTNMQVLAVDSLSGFSLANSETFINADFLAEIGVKKIENLFAKQCCKKYSFHPIAFPLQEFLTQKEVSNFLLKKLSKRKIKSIVQRKFDSHKYSNGYAAFIGGSKNMSGAILLAQRAFHASGGGFSKVFTPSEKTILVALKKNPSFLYEKLNANLTQEETWKKVTSIVLGPGLNPQDLNIPIEFFLEQKKFLIIDAGALSLIKQKTLSDKVLLTPHRGEFQNLIDKKPNSEAEWIHELKLYSKQYNCNVLLKGHVTILALPNSEVYFFPYSNPKLSVMGTGDLLSGILGYSIYKLNSIVQGVQFSLSFLHLSKKIKFQFPSAMQILNYLEELNL